MRYLIISIILALTGCSSKFDDCVELEKENYRKSHPNASYGLIQNKMAEFEMSCSQFKGK